MNGKELSRALRYGLGRVLVAGLTRLPPEVGRAVGAAAGRVGWWTVARDRRLALDNLRHAFPEADERARRRLARRVFEELGRNVFDVAAWPRRSPEYRRRKLRLEGADHLRQALATGRGALLLAAHQGAWELVPVALAAEGFRVQAVARSLREPRLQRWLDGHRRALGVRTIPRGAVSGTRAARRVLEEGESLGILFDHRVRRGGQWVEFFGRPSRFVAGPVRLAWRCGAAIVPVSIVREADGGHRVTLRAPVAWPAAGEEAVRPGEAPGPASGKGAVVEEMVRRCVRELEAMIREAPEQWVWIHPRWAERAPAAARAAGRAALLVALVAGLGLAAGCGQRKAPAVVASPKRVDTGPEASTYGFTTRETFDGRLKWVLRADSAQTWDDRGQTILSNLRVDFYNEEQVVYSVLTADEGAVYRSTNNVAASGHVHVTTTDGDTLTTEHLAWQNAAGRVKTDDPFRLARPTGVLTGTGFESDPGLKNYTTKDVTIDAR